MPELGKKEYQSEEFISVFLSSQNLGQKTLLTQHLLGQPYFKSVSDEEIVVEWQQVAGHGRGQIDAEGTLSKRVSETSNGMSYMEQRYLYIEREWKLSSVKPSILFETGDLTALRK